MELGSKRSSFWKIDLVPEHFLIETTNFMKIKSNGWAKCAMLGNVVMDKISNLNIIFQLSSVDYCEPSFAEFCFIISPIEIYLYFFFITLVQSGYP